MKKKIRKLKKRVTQLPQHLKTRRLVAQFMESIGWVYFGRVNQHDDEHIPVRGFTVSVKHQDAHYSSGMLGDYNAIFVTRTDKLAAPGKPSLEYRWLILKLDLHTRHHPHLFVTPVNHPPLFYEYFFTKQYHFRQVDVSLWWQHDPTFTSRFAVFTSRDKIYDAPSFLSTELTRGLADNFKDIEFEVQDNQLYVYSTSPRITAEVLEMLIKNGLWLAQQLDK